MRTNAEILMFYHVNYPGTSFGEFMSRLNQLIGKWSSLSNLPYAPYIEMFETNLQFVPRCIMPECKLLDYLLSADFVVVLENLFSSIDTTWHNGLFEDKNLESFILKHTPTRPDLIYQYIGGNPKYFITKIDLLPRFDFYQLSGPLKGTQKFTPGVCLKKFFILNLYLKCDREGEIYINTVRGTRFKHIEFSSISQRSTDLRLSWSSYEPLPAASPQVKYPHAYVNINQNSIRNWSFFYQDYQADINVAKADALSTRHDFCNAITLALNQNNINVSYYKGKFCRNNVKSSEWRVAQHMFVTYLRAKHRVYENLHQYKDMVKYEQKYFQLADQYLIKLHEDLTFYTAEPLLEVETQEEVEVETKTVVVEKETVEKIETRYTPDLIRSVDDETLKEVKMVKNEFEEYIGGTGPNLLKILEAKERPPSEWSAVAGYPVGKSLKRVWTQTIKELDEWFAKGYCRDDIVKYIEKSRSPPLSPWEEKIAEHFNLPKDDKIKARAVKEEQKIKKLLDNYPGYWVTDKEVLYTKKEKVEMNQEVRHVRKINKYVTNTTVPLGVSLYRKVDCSHEKERQEKSKYVTPWKRRCAEINNNLKKKEKQRYSSPKVLLGMSLEEINRSFKEHFELLQNKKWAAQQVKHAKWAKRRAEAKFGENGVEKAMKLHQFHQKRLEEAFYYPQPCEMGIKGTEVKAMLKHKKPKSHKKRKELRGKRTINQSVTSSMWRVEKIQPHSEFNIPDEMFSRFQKAKKKAVLSKVAWVRRDEEEKRTRKVLKSPKDGLYRLLYLAAC